jgi:hypothetical protein
MLIGGLDVPSCRCELLFIKGSVAPEFDLVVTELLTWQRPHATLFAPAFSRAQTMPRDSFICVAEVDETYFDYRK